MQLLDSPEVDFVNAIAIPFVFNSLKGYPGQPGAAPGQPGQPGE